MGCRVTISDAGVDDLLDTPKVKRLAESNARAVARAAGELAPRRTGRLARSYRATKAEVTSTGVSARAYTAVPYGHLVEWGTAAQAPKAPLRRAAQRVGLRLRITPKGG